MKLSSSGVQNTPICYGVPKYFYTKSFQDWSPEILTEDTIVPRNIINLTIFFL